MKFSTDFKPELCASKDPYRHALAQTHFDPAGKRLIATDGHRMAVVPCEPEKGDVCGPVDAEALDTARKIAKKKGLNTAEVAIGENVVTLADGRALPRETVGQFLNTDYVVPKFEAGTEGTVTIALDPVLLAGLAKAIGADKVVLTFDLDTSKGFPILVRPRTPQGTEFGVLMPVHG